MPRATYKYGKICNPFIETMNEIWRTLKPGGVFTLKPPHTQLQWHFKIQPMSISSHQGSTIFRKENGYRATQYYGFIGSFKDRKNEWHQNKCHLQQKLEALKKIIFTFKNLNSKLITTRQSCTMLTDKSF